jgi:chromate transporter
VTTPETSDTPTSKRPDTGPSDGSADMGTQGSALEVLLVSTKLGLTSFGGPVAHIGYFHHEYVERRKWLEEDVFAELVAVTAALPGPSSSQLGISIGLVRAGIVGAFLAWLGFTLPSAAALTVFGFVVKDAGNLGDASWVHGLKLAAVAVVAFAVWGMAKNLAPDKERATIAMVAAIVALSWQSAIASLVIILVAALVGWRMFLSAGARADTHLPIRVGRNVAIGAWVLFFGLLLGLPILSAAAHTQSIDLFDRFYRIGSLVFGGGHVVLPLIQREVVEPHWVTPDQFLAGYGAAQAVPGPLFTLSAYLGTVMGPAPNGVAGATIALTAIFLPSFFFVIGGLPAWSFLRRYAAFMAALRGVNAAVVGLLLAALYNPVFISGVKSAEDFSLAIAAFGLLAFWKTPPWLVVVLTAIGAVVVDAV